MRFYIVYIYLCVLFALVMEIWNRLVTEIVILYNCIGNAVGVGTNAIPVQLYINVGLQFFIVF